MVSLCEEFHSRVIRLLKDVAAKRPEGSEDFLFMQPEVEKDGCLFSSRRATRAYLRALPSECFKLVGIERHVTFMNWRHCCVGLMVEAGVGERESMRFTGHKTAAAFRGYVAQRIQEDRYKKALKRRQKFEKKLNLKGE